MEQNLVSDEELLERINKVLHDSKDGKRETTSEGRQEESNLEKFHDVYETAEQAKEDSDVKIISEQKSLVLENRYLSLQLQAEKKKSKELQSKYKLFENSVKYFERLNGLLENIKKAVEEDSEEAAKEDPDKLNAEAMQKIRPKTIHTTVSGIESTQEEGTKDGSNFSEPHTSVDNDQKTKIENGKEEVAFRDANDFKQLEQDLEIVKDKNAVLDEDDEKVFITKTEKRCLEDIGNIASRTRAPLDDKHQRYFERDRRRFANSITMPETQEVDHTEVVPPEIISNTKETPVNITSTEFHGLRSYLLQLKELIARRETAWARTTEQNYNQRVEITRFKNEVSHLRMLCEKRQRDIKEKDQIITAKEEEIRELQKRIQGLRNALMKLEKKEERAMEKADGMSNEAVENSQIIQRSYNAMKRQSMINRASSLNIGLKTLANVTQPQPQSPNKELLQKKSKVLPEKTPSRKNKLSESTSNEENKSADKTKHKARDKLKSRQRGDSVGRQSKPKEMCEKLQRVEEILYEVRGSKKKSSRQPIDFKTLIKNTSGDKLAQEFIRKSTPSNSTIRQEMLSAMTGINLNPIMGLRPPGLRDPKKGPPTAAVIANALMAGRNANIFHYQ